MQRNSLTKTTPTSSRTHQRGGDCASREFLRFSHRLRQTNPPSSVQFKEQIKWRVGAVLGYGPSLGRNAASLTLRPAAANHRKTRPLYHSGSPFPSLIPFSHFPYPFQSFVPWSSEQWRMDMRDRVIWLRQPEAHSSREISEPDAEASAATFTSDATRSTEPLSMARVGGDA